MKLLRRWDYDKQAYEPYEVPDEWIIRSYGIDLDETINCAQCGREVAFGDCYTSKEIHAPHGFGYAVCGECYHKERAREEKWRKREQTKTERHSL